MNVVLAAFPSYVLNFAKSSNKKHARKTLMKLTTAVSKKDTCFKSDQNWLENKHLALLVKIYEKII